VPVRDTLPRRVASPVSPRLAALAQSAPAALMLFSEGGALLAENEAASAAFGGASLAELLGSPDKAAGVVAAVRRHGRVGGEAELVTVGGHVWFSFQARATSDPETGAFAVSLAADDITERRSAERAKDEFISVVNHELRTPLTAIRGAVGLLANDVVGDPSQKTELFDIAWENVQRLRLGAVDLVLATIEVEPLIAETLELLSPPAEEVGVVLRLVPPAEGALPVSLVRADPGRLVQALSNLVTNAVKHAPPGSAVTVSVTEGDGRVRVSVCDEGPGVPASFVPSLFAPFTQADSSDARAQGGAGLGLYIVRTLVEAHGGRVGYVPSPSGGSNFYFDLPAVSAPDSVDAGPVGAPPG
jgi:signal transduction histidine kinase